MTAPRTPRKKSRCLDGRHVPSRKLIWAERLQDGSDVSHARCARCGHELVKSFLTNRWRLTGPLG